MNWKQTWLRHRAPGGIGALFTILLGVCLWLLPLSDGLVQLSYDLPSIFAARPSPPGVVLIKMDELSYRELDQDYAKGWNRSLHAQLLDRLRAAQCRLVVFDVFFADAGAAADNERLATAMKRQGAVVIAADRGPLALSKARGEATIPPREEFRQAAAAWGLGKVVRETDGTVRQHYAGTEVDPSLAWAAAKFLRAPVTRAPRVPSDERWLRYYGPDGTLTNMSYYVALDAAPESFRDKVVFIGGKPLTRHTGEELDQFRTPFTRWDNTYTSGMEITATEFSNLLQDDWVRRGPALAEFAGLVLAGLIFGFGLGRVRPWPGAGVALAGMLGVAALSLILFHQRNLWFPWIIVVTAQIPFAWGWSVLSRANAARKTEPVKHGPAAAQRDPDAGAAPATGPAPVMPVAIAVAEGSNRPSPPNSPAASARAAVDPPPPIGGHILLQQVGRGAYGEVWLARDVIGGFHAVKIIYRRSFTTDSPFEREFRGIQKFTPISRTHPGFVHILHVERDDAAGYFYYVMEAGDDEVTGQKIDPAAYVPKNLARELARRGRIPIEESLRLSVSLAAALDYLHCQQLIHRDIKPSNIIFVNGAPKLADIGLVTDLGRPGKGATYVGTEGYMAPEGPGTAAADVYSLGRVIYEAAMGRTRAQFPELPTTLLEHPSELGALVDFNDIILKACAPDPRERYQTAGELHADLMHLHEQVVVQSRAGAADPPAPVPPPNH